MDKVNILVVEDEVLVLLMLQSALEEGGFAVVTATSGAAAVRILDAQDQPFRALVTDVNLARGESGWDVAKRAREIDPCIAVIYLSGHGAAEWASHGLPKSVMISKPFAEAQLMTAVSNLLNETPHSE